MLNDYVLFVTPRDNNFRPPSEDISRIIDFLDLNFYLEGPDRDLSNLVKLPLKETKNWAELAMPPQPTLVAVGLGTDAVITVPALRKRYVNLLHSPTALDEPYRSYSQLCNLIENLQPRDTPFVASLGRGARAAWRAFYCPRPHEDRNRWIKMQTVSLVSGYHPIWCRVWDAQIMHKEWELVTVKAFKIVISCTLNSRAEKMSIDEFVAGLQASSEYQKFAQQVGHIIGNPDLELLGFDLR